MDHTIIYRVITGSRLYGLETEDSDTDYGNVVLEPKEHLLGASPAAHALHQTVTEKVDNAKHWLGKFCWLCAKGNPNVIEWIWAPEDRVITCHEAFAKHILPIGASFLGLKYLRDSHFGFAKSQIMKMKKANGEVGEKRRNFVAEYGYDIKFACHALRLVWQLIEIADTGTVKYPISDGRHQTLMDIKTGRMPLKAFEELYTDVHAVGEQAVTENKAGIPEFPDFARIDKGLVDFYEDWYWSS